MEINLQKFEEKDYERYVEFYNHVHPDDFLGLEMIKETEGRYSMGAFMERYLLEHNHELIAATTLKRDLNKMTVMGIVLSMVIDPDFGHLESVLYKELVREATKHKPVYFKTTVRENWQAQLDFYLAQGFTELERMWGSTLDLADFEPEKFEWAIKKAKDDNISFKTLDDFEDNEKTQRMVYELVIALLADVPHEEKLDIWPFEIWLKRFWRGTFRRDESFFLALDGDDLVGISMLGMGKKEDELGTGLTGVLRNHRRKGIAQALKLQAAKYALANGFKRIITSNHSINRPMLSINEAMGFKKEPAWVYLKKDLDE